MSSIKNIGFVKQLVSIGIIFINQEVAAWLHYSEVSMTESLIDPLHLLINKCSVVIFRNTLTFSRATPGYKATKFDDCED